jgi:hypothetical protein
MKLKKIVWNFVGGPTAFWRRQDKFTFVEDGIAALLRGAYVEGGNCVAVTQAICGKLIWRRGADLSG